MHNDRTLNWEKQFIKHGQILRGPSIQPEGTLNNVSYELGTIFQLDQEHCLLIASMDEQGGHDLCVGNDGFIFKSISEIKAENYIKINRPVADYTLKSGKGPAYLAKYPALGGFIPLGATLEDGTPHPAAGTGFCLSECMTYLSDRSDYLFPPEGDVLTEIIQIKWDGSNLTVSTSILPSSLPGAPELSILGIGFAAVPEKTGLLFPVVTNKGIVTVLFEYVGDNWIPAYCGKPFKTDNRQEDASLLLMGPEKEIEPSIRKINGLFYVYTRGSKKGRLYSSKDGMDFVLTAEKDNICVPQILNEGLDGSMYITTNTGPGILRNPLLAFPIKGNSFGEPFIMHDQGGIYTDIGEEIPFVDHAMGFNIYLEGCWRHIITYRVCDLKERSIAAVWEEMDSYIHHGSAPKPSKRDYSGLYMAEIIYDKTTERGIGFHVGN